MARGRIVPLTIPRLRELLSYDPQTGALMWLVSRGRIAAGDIAGTLKSARNTDYVQVGIQGKLYLAHRLGWALHYGRWPSDLLDHRDGIGVNNHIKNLRDADHRINGENLRKPNSNNTSGYLGVSPKGEKFRAVIRHQNCHIEIGLYDDPTLAHQNYLKVKRQLHKGNTL